ncbi:MAG: hypothetical protein MUF16_04215 [Burkholderiaceae bacterium]|jgi:hypothetical protein|nr:hypothetical protein [Burkholderiaceae bacterium]
MRFRMPDSPLAMTMLWIWVGFVVVSIACWYSGKWWKKRHPPAKPEPLLPYSQRLQRRYRERRMHGRAGGASDVGELPRKR